MEKGEKRGVILVDEMKLSEGVYFDQQSMKFSGFVDLGKHTPEDLKNKTADHALVFKFVPFKGRWVQSLGCFLSKNACKSEPLHKLIVECIILMENSEINVDVVVMDGASWNRGVWKIFGVDENNISCEHPYHSSRRLWMISDFNHLVKCFRTSTLDDKLHEFKTPFGTVKKQHWEALLEEENYRQPNLKIAYKLTHAHLKSKGFQAMNVPLATEVFGHEVSVGMAHYQSTFDKLKDSTPTQKFIDLVFSLIQAMSSRIPRDALYVKDDCRQRQAIFKFLKFLEDWEKLDQKIPVSRSTLLGLKVTLRATIEILEMLKIECDFKYLMTATLSQDPLERFFPVMRHSCGGNDHPDPKMFAQVYRLASSFSLIRPPRGCNVSGKDLLRSLIEAKHVLISSDTQGKDT
ncbi:unnamed protein product [Euphydryas editha]|uniref:Transposable element P transposase n=1 Tax=Euphydryas editha TaxID=104508 RepID=A0AAU9TZT1_EUPED|nr:unnamed protein product [Euphydryas editha]